MFYRTGSTVILRVSPEFVVFRNENFQEDAINFRGSRSGVTKQEVDPSLK